MKWIGAVALGTAVIVGPARIESVAAMSTPPAVRGSQASNASTEPTDISARRHVRRYHRDYHSGYRHDRHAYRPYYPRYYARPYYYEPDPSYVPLPFGFGFGPWW